MRVRASHAEAERPRLFPLSQGQYVCEVRSRWEFFDHFPDRTMDPDSGSMVVCSSARSLTAVLTGFWTLEADLKKQMVFVRSKELEHIAGVRTDCSPF